MSKRPKPQDEERNGLRRVALQLAQQLPPDRDEALQVVASLRDLVDFLHPPSEAPLPICAVVSGIRLVTKN